MKLLLRRLLWFSVGALLITALTSVAFDGVRSRTEHEIQQEREGLRLSREAAALATDRETGIRGYLLTHSPISLAPEVRARQLLPPILDSIRMLSPNDATARARVDSVRNAISHWEKGFASLALREDALPGGGTLAGKGLFDNIRVQFQALIGSQERQYRDMVARRQRIQLLDTGLTLFELAAFVGALLFFIRKRLIHQTDEMIHQQQMLEQQAVELELQLAELQATNDALAEREETLRKSEERYRYVARATDDAIYDWDVASNRFEWNEGLQELFGYSEAEVGTTIEWIVSLLHPEDTERVMGSFYAVFEKGGGSEWRTNYRLRRKDGKYAEAEGRAHIIRGPDGNPQRVIGAISDRTQQQSLEAQLRQSQKMEAIGRLAGGIAHDFNNILTVIRMSSEFLLTDLPESDDKFQDATEIMKASDRAARLTRQLLAFSRHQVLNPSVMSLNDIVGGMDGMVRRVLPENIELMTELAPELRSIRADTGQMEQVLLNLVINAADAMPQGGKLSIRTSNAQVDSSFSARNLDVPAGDYVCLTVSDTGIGMDQETVAKIFDPFFTTKGVGKGTGLGLSTVHGIVTQTGGKIWVYSELGLGTTFRVFLPRAEGTLTPTGSVVVHEDGAPPTETVMIVEDEEATRLAIHRNLSRVGYTVIDASNGVEGLRVAESYPGTIHLLLTDSMMPEMGGTELVRELRKNRPHINVLMMSGYTEDLAANFGDGQNEFFIEKPFNTVDLLAAIRSALSSASHLASPQDSTERDLS
ncbi:MAG: ATP-binding protein [Gemmatimonadaceae bacterium]